MRDRNLVVMPFTYRISPITLFVVLLVLSYFFLAELSSEVRPIMRKNGAEFGYWTSFLSSRGTTEMVMLFFVISAFVSRRFFKNRANVVIWFLILFLLAYTLGVSSIQIQSLIHQSDRVWMDH